MSAKMALSEINAAMLASQTGFLSLLDETAEAMLYQILAGDDWPMGVVLLHLSEAREHFASDIENLAVSNFAAPVGRTLTHEGRLAAIAAAAEGSLSKANIRARLAESHDTMMTALSRLQEQDLGQTITNQNPKFGEQPLWEFLGHFVVEHDRLHLDQAKAVSEEATR